MVTGLTVGVRVVTALLGFGRRRLFFAALSASDPALRRPFQTSSAPTRDTGTGEGRAKAAGVITPRGPGPDDPVVGKESTSAVDTLYRSAACG